MLSISYYPSTTYIQVSPIFRFPAWLREKMSGDFKEALLKKEFQESLIGEPGRSKAQSSDRRLASKL